jgi:hypothetical protein
MMRDGWERRRTVGNGEGRECHDVGLLVMKAKNGNGPVMGQNHYFYRNKDLELNFFSQFNRFQSRTKLNKGFEKSFIK